MPLELSQLRLLPPTLVRLRLGAFLPLLEGSVYIWPNDAFPALESLHLEAHLTVSFAVCTDLLRKNPTRLGYCISRQGSGSKAESEEP